MPMIKIDISGLMDEHYKRGDKLVGMNKLDEAIIEFKKSVEVTQRLYLPYGELGNCYNQKGNYEEAVKYYNLSIEDAPEGMTTKLLYFNKALALKKLGKYSDAIVDLKEVLRQDPKESNAWTLKSNCHRARREYEEAVISIDKALEINPKNLLARQNKAAILNIKGDEETAQKILNESLSIEPIDFQSWTIKGEQLIALGNFKEAKKSYDEAVKISSGHPYAYQLSEKCKQKQQQYKDIRKKLPQNSAEWNSRGIKLYQIGVYTEALGCFKSALRSDSNNINILMNKASTLRALKKYRAALNDTENLIRKNPKDATAWNIKGELLFVLEQYDKALKSYEKALEINPNLTIAQKNKEATLKLLNLNGSSLGSLGNNQGAVDKKNRTVENVSQNRLKKKKKKVSDKDISRALDKVFEDSLYNYLENQGAAFTIKALEKRLESFIEDLNERKYGRENLEKTLNKLRTQGLINSSLHDKETHYFVRK
ncbi:MAG: tetratricopeptide repeat protein [Promethearchaeota archaeon]